MRHEPFEKNAFFGMATSMLLAIFIAVGGIPALALAQGIDGAPAAGADDLHGRSSAADAGGIAKAAGFDGGARMDALVSEAAAETDAQDGEGAEGWNEAHGVFYEIYTMDRFMGHRLLRIVYVRPSVLTPLTANAVRG